ncbi:hypothetical protein QQ045_032601 [Rhodiola kirilowii]
MESNNKVELLDSTNSNFSNNLKGIMGRAAENLEASFGGIKGSEEEICHCPDQPREQNWPQGKSCPEDPKAYVEPEIFLVLRKDDDHLTLQGSGERIYIPRVNVIEAAKEEHFNGTRHDDPYTTWDPGPHLWQQNLRRGREGSLLKKYISP